MCKKALFKYLSHILFCITSFLFLFVFNEIFEIVILIINFRMIAKDQCERLSVNEGRYDLKSINFYIYLFFYFMMIIVIIEMHRLKLLIKIFIYILAFKFNVKYVYRSSNGINM